MANRSRITFGIKLRGRLKEKSFGIYELRDIILQVHYCKYSLQGGTQVKVQSNAVNCYIRLNRYFCSTLYLRTPFFPPSYPTITLYFTEGTVDPADIEDLFDQLEDYSDSGPDADTISIGSTPKPSLKPFFCSSRNLLHEARSVVAAAAVAKAQSKTFWLI